jgi:hypothetical protein
MNEGPAHWSRRAVSAVVLLLVIAVGARVVYGLLVPLFPAAMAFIILAVVFVLIFGRRRS